MEPGAYDLLMKVSSYGVGIVLASNVVVREGTLTHINPNPLVGGIEVEPLSKKGFPLIKNLQFIDRSSTNGCSPSRPTSSASCCRLLQARTM